MQFALKMGAIQPEINNVIQQIYYYINPEYNQIGDDEEYDEDEDYYEEDGIEYHREDDDEDYDNDADIIFSDVQCHVCAQICPLCIRLPIQTGDQEQYICIDCSEMCSTCDGINGCECSDE